MKTIKPIFLAFRDDCGPAEPSNRHAVVKSRVRPEDYVVAIAGRPLCRHNIEMWVAMKAE